MAISRLFPVPFFGADTPISKVDLTFVALHDVDDAEGDVDVSDADDNDDGEAEKLYFYFSPSSSTKDWTKKCRSTSLTNLPICKIVFFNFFLFLVFSFTRLQ